MKKYLILLFCFSLLAAGLVFSMEGRAQYTKKATGTDIKEGEKPKGVSFDSLQQQLAEESTETKRVQQEVIKEREQERMQQIRQQTTAR